MWFDQHPREDVKFKKKNKNKWHDIKKGTDVQTIPCVQITVSIPASTKQYSKPVFPKALPGALGPRERTSNQMGKNVATRDQTIGSESYSSTSGLCIMSYLTSLIK